MSEQETAEESITELRLELDQARQEADHWKSRCIGTGEELRRTQLLLEVSQTKFDNLQKILDRYPIGRTAREIALVQAVHLSGPLDQEDILQTAERFEKWLTNG